MNEKTIFIPYFSKSLMRYEIIFINSGEMRPSAPDNGPNIAAVIYVQRGNYLWCCSRHPYLIRFMRWNLHRYLVKWGINCFQWTVKANMTRLWNNWTEMNRFCPFQLSVHLPQSSVCLGHKRLKFKPILDTFSVAFCKMSLFIANTAFKCTNYGGYITYRIRNFLPILFQIKV